MFTLYNIEKRLRDNCHRGKAIILHILSLCVFVDLLHTAVGTHKIEKYWCYSTLSKQGIVGSRFCDGSFYDDSLLRPLSSRTERSRLVVHHCHNSSVLSLLSALLALFRCACVSYFSILVQFFKLSVIFPPMTSIKKTEKKEKSKQFTLHSFIMYSEPQPGPSSAK